MSWLRHPRRSFHVGRFDFENRQQLKEDARPTYHNVAAGFNLAGPLQGAVLQAFVPASATRCLGTQTSYSPSYDRSTNFFGF